MPDKMFILNMVTSKKRTRLEYQDLFADMGIGKGPQQYERGKKMLQNMGLDDKEYERAIKQLARWCGI